MNSGKCWVTWNLATGIEQNNVARFHVMSHHWIPGRTPLNIIDILVAGHMKRWPERCSVLHYCIYYSEALCQHNLKDLCQHHLLPHWSKTPKMADAKAVAPFYLGFLLGNSVSSLRVLRLFRAWLSDPEFFLCVLAAALLQLYSTILEHIGTWSCEYFPDYRCVCVRMYGLIYTHISGYFCM